MPPSGNQFTLCNPGVCNRRRGLAILLAVCFIASGLPAQTSDFRFLHLTVEDGLSSNTVYSILQDSRGFIWFGTSEGLNRYDGRRIRVWRHDPADSTSLSSNYIWFESLAEDHDGGIWVGTRDSGINRFDPVTETFRRYRHDPDDPLSLSSDKNITLFVDSQGTLWVGTDRGLNRFDATTHTFARFRHNPEDPGSLIHDRIWEVGETGEGGETSLWIATHAGLDRLERDTGTFDHIELQNLNPKSATQGPITDLCDGQDGTLWLGSAYGLGRLDLATMHLQMYRHDPDDENSLNFNLITDLALDGTRGGVWITTRRGLNRFDVQTAAFSRFARNPAIPSGIQAISVVALHKDIKNRLWIGSHSDGVNILDRKVRPFKLIKHNPEDPASLSGYLVRAIHTGGDGRVWIGTENGLNIWQPNAGAFEKVLFPAALPGVHGANVISGIAEDGLGQIWLGTRGGGLIRYDPIRKSHQRYLHDSEQKHSISSDDVGRIYIDSRDDLWVGTTNQVLAVLAKEDRENGRFREVLPAPEDASHLSQHRGFAFLEDHHGNIWIGAPFRGLYRFARERGVLESYGTDNTSGQAPDNTAVNGLVEITSDGDTTIWMATEDGLRGFDRKTREFRAFPNTTQGGSDFIFALAKDDSNHLWVTNQRGISKFDTRREVWINFAGSHGLPADMSNEYGVGRTRGGELVFAGRGGMLAFHPDSIPTPLDAPPVFLTGLQVNNKPAVLDSAITSKKLVVLAPHRNYLSFAFAALEYDEPEAVRYAYKMEGLDPDWNDAGNLPLANYAAVPPGSYVFRARAANRYGVWTPEPASIVIEVSPPWWQTGWAYAGYVLALGVVLYSVRRFERRRDRMRAELAMQTFKSEKLLELDGLKSRFFANISHELRTPLTLILGPIQNVLARTADAEKREHLHLVQRSAQRLRRIVDQLLDLSRIDAGRMALDASPQDINTRIREWLASFASLAESRSITLHLQAPLEPVIVSLDADKFEQVIFNLLGNAFKYTPDGGSVSVTVTVEGEDTSGGLENRASTVSIAVADTGVGISRRHIEHIFDRFYRAEEGESVDQKGTGIGLALARELIALHGGGITVESAPGKGSVFTIALPVHPGDLPLGQPQPRRTDRAAEAQEIGFSLAPSADPPQRTVVAQPADAQLPTVLVVEDNQDMLGYLRKSLEGSFRVLEAENGEAGARLAKTEMPDLVISDVMMPVMDGFALCNRLKSDESTSHIPIILLSARAERTDRLTGLETGADDYLIKPFDATELRTRSHNLIRQRQQLKTRFEKKLVIKPADIAASSMDEVFLKRVLDAVEANMNNPVFTTDELARNSGYGRRQLNRKLRALTGQSVREFIRTMRLKRAAQLLQQGWGTVTEVCYATGFQHPGHFARVFREQFGVTPSGYLKEHTG